MTEGSDRPAAGPVAGWAASGAMWLTGHADGPPLSPAAAVVPALERAAAVLFRLSADRGHPVDVDLGVLLTGRAALRGFERRGRTSANASCRLLPTADGWAAVNLARPSDVESIGALVERPVDGDPEDALADGVAKLPGDDLVERAALLGVPAATVPGRPPPPKPFIIERLGPARSPRLEDRPLVIDLSAMWAGPLCAHLLGRAGFRVVKVESTGRPDGARAGHAGFFRWLNGGHASVALDLASTNGRAALAGLVARADVVVESSRPRALAQLGIDAAAVVAARSGLTWVSITGYGRAGTAGQRVAFGDDAAAAAGLVAYDDEGGPVFCGDAIADPVTGLYAAVAALTAVADGGGVLIDAPMVDAVAATLAEPVAPTAAHPTIDGAWKITTPAGAVQVARPRRPNPEALATSARPLGADTATVLAELGLDTPAGASAPC